MRNSFVLLMILLTGCVTTPPDAPPVVAPATEVACHEGKGVQERLAFLACKLAERIKPFDLAGQVVVHEAETGQAGACGGYFAARLQESLFDRREPKARPVAVAGSYRLDNPFTVLVELRVKGGLEPSTVEIPRDEATCLAREEKAQAQALLAGFDGDEKEAELAARVAARATLLERTEQAQPSPLLNTWSELPAMLAKLGLGVIQNETHALGSNDSVASALVRGTVHRLAKPDQAWVSGVFPGQQPFRAGDVMRYTLRSHSQQPLYVGIFTLDLEDRVLRIYPNSRFASQGLARLVLAPQGRLDFPRPGESHLPRFCARGSRNPHDHRALIIVSSPEADFAFESLAAVIGNSPTDSFKQARKTAYQIFMGKLAASAKPYSLTVVPFMVQDMQGVCGTED